MKQSDDARGNRPLHCHPSRDQRLDALCRYSGNGRLRTEDPDLAEDISVLNLNASLLKRNREAALDALILRLGRKKRTPGRLRAEREK